jgi:hypothetical protein
LASLACRIPTYAATVTYTFESPAFSWGETTPSFTNRTPNIGSSSFEARFDVIGALAGLKSETTQICRNGMSLVQSQGNFVLVSLIVSLNTPVDSVTFDFALSEPGSLFFHSPGGNSTVSTGPSSLVGVFNFSSPTPFNGFIMSTSLTGQGPHFSIDNLVMNVPEPSTLAFIGIAALTVLGRRSRKRAAR